MNFFNVVVMNWKHIQTEKYKIVFRKNIYRRDKILVRLRMILRVVYIHNYTLPFFWKSLKVLKISSILVSFLQFFSPKLGNPPRISYILLDFEFEKPVGTLISFNVFYFFFVIISMLSINFVNSFSKIINRIW